MTHSHEITISGNHFTDTSGTAIQFGDLYIGPPEFMNHDSVIKDNYIHDTPVEYQGGIGIVVGIAHGVTISNNELDNLPYTAISVGWGNLVDVSQAAGAHGVHNNLVQRAVNHLCDGGSFYSAGIQDTSYVYDNVFLNQQRGLAALYLDHWSAYYQVYNNVIFDNLSLTARINPGEFPNQQQNNVTANYWQDRGMVTPPCVTTSYPDILVTGPPGQVHDNTVITALNQAPASILDEAGLEDTYEDIKVLPQLPPWP